MQETAGDRRVNPTDTGKDDALPEGVAEKEETPSDPAPEAAEPRSRLGTVIAAERLRYQRVKVGRREKTRKIPSEETSIPRLDPDADLFSLMGGDADAEGPAREPVLKRGEITGEFPTRAVIPLWPEPEKTVDLHGLKADEAATRIRSALRTARMEGRVSIRLITGKGLHSDQGRAVLRDVADHILSDLQRTGEVRAFRWEQRTKKRSGAVLVRLPDP